MLQQKCVPLLVLSQFSCVWLFVTLRTVAHQAPLSMRFSRQEYWSGLSFPYPEDLPNPGIHPTCLMSPVLGGGFFTNNFTWKNQSVLGILYNKKGGSFYYFWFPGLQTLPSLRSDMSDALKSFMSKGLSTWLRKSWEAMLRWNLNLVEKGRYWYLGLGTLSKLRAITTSPILVVPPGFRQTRYPSWYCGNILPAFLGAS